MKIEFTPSGIHLPEIGIWLDPRQPVETAWISHAHAGITGSHREIATAPTHALLSAHPDRQDPGTRQTVQWDQPFEFGGARFTALPAGHVLGAAQLLIEWRGERVVYTGDVKRKQPVFGAGAQAVPCGRLIIESTFGLPIFRFLSREEVRVRVLQFARECLAENDVPVFLASPLGRAQDVAWLLGSDGIAAALEEAAYRFLKVYQDHGYAFPDVSMYAGGSPAGRAVVAAPGSRRTIQAQGRKFRFAYVSGWASMDNARARVGAEELIPYSDHAGFDELLELIEGSGASEVDVVHGYTEPLAHILRSRMIAARAPEPAAARAAAEDVEG